MGAKQSKKIQKFCYLAGLYFAFFKDNCIYLDILEDSVFGWLGGFAHWIGVYIISDYRSRR